jgi:hypothetical protein
MPVAFANRRRNVRLSSPAAAAMEASRDISSISYVHPILSLQHSCISVRLPRSKARKIARLTRGWLGQNKASRFRLDHTAKDPVHQKQANVDPRHGSARRDNVAMVNNPPPRIDMDFRKPLRQRLRANAMCRNPTPGNQTRFGEEEGA